jgi:hypothetical protein
MVTLEHSVPGRPWVVLSIVVLSVGQMLTLFIACLTLFDSKTPFLFRASTISSFVVLIRRYRVGGAARSRCRELKVDETLLVDLMAKDRLMEDRDFKLVHGMLSVCPGKLCS